MNENCIILYDFVSDLAVLSGGSWMVGLPLANVQDERVHILARSTDLDLANTQMAIALPWAHPVVAVVLDDTNMTAQALFRVRGFQDAAHITMLYDSDWLPIVEPMPFGSIPYGNPYLYDGMTDDRGLGLIHVLPSALLARYWTIELDDQDNAAGVLDIGRLVIGKSVQPSINYGLGAGLSFGNNTMSATTLSGGKVFWKRRNPRVTRFSFDHLEEAEAFLGFYDMNVTAGYDGQVFFIPNPALKDGRLFRRSYLGNFSQMDALTDVAFGLAGAGYEITEVIL
jgi:hypothetical protein